MNRQLSMPILLWSILNIRTRIAPLLRFFSLVSSILLFSVTAMTASGLPQPKNNVQSDTVILLLIDALRADHVGVYGYSRPTTPILDAFAKESTRYTRAYVNSPWTRPSTATLLTGLHASRHETETAKSKLPKRIKTLAQRFKRAGYTTAGFTANGNGGSLAGLQKGFDIFEDPSKTYPKSIRGETYCCYGLPSGEFIVNRVGQWLKKDKSKKRFIFIFLVDPHDPYGAPAEMEAMMLGKDFNGKLRRHALWERGNTYPKDEQYSLVALYDAGIRNADKATGMLFSLFKDKGIYDEATIIVTADHGEGFGEHGFYLHAHHFWEEVIHVPVFAKGPRFAKGHSNDRLVDSTDIAKTLLLSAGANTKDLPGVVLHSSKKKEYVISEYNEFGIHRQAIVSDRYKVIWQRPADEAWYLREAKKKEYFPSVVFDKERVRMFDLKTDPGEKIDLVAAGQTPEAGKALLKILRKHVGPY